MMKVFVAGSAGQLGRALADRAAAAGVGCGRQCLSDVLGSEILATEADPTVITSMSPRFALLLWTRSCPAVKKNFWGRTRSRLHLGWGSTGKEACCDSDAMSEELYEVKNTRKELSAIYKETKKAAPVEAAPVEIPTVWRHEACVLSARYALPSAAM